jgi:hypothetical protein
MVGCFLLILGEPTPTTKGAHGAPILKTSELRGEKVNGEIIIHICNYKSSRTRNLMAQRVVACLKNAQKLTDMRMQFQKYFRGYTIGPPLKWGENGIRREREGKGKEVKGEEGGVACLTTFPSVVHPALIPLTAPLTRY